MDFTIQQVKLELKNNVLIITNVDERENLLTQHELAHYWYDRMCVGIDLQRKLQKYTP